MADKKKHVKFKLKNKNVRCKNCKYLIFSDCYGECSKGIAGIVSPDFFCGMGKRIKTERK